MDKNNLMYLVLGDWSSDGHGITEKIKISANKTHLEIQEAYLNSVKLTTLGFDDHNVKDSKLRIAVEYEDVSISDEAVAILEKFKCPIYEFAEVYNNHYQLKSDNFTDFWFWFVTLSLPDLEWEEVNDDIPNINGFWDKKLNVQFAYGLFDQ